MDLQKALRSRRSIRAFRPDPLPRELLEGLVELANTAPSAGNLQSRDFVLVTAEETRQALARAALDQQFIAQAPAVLVVCANAQRVRSKYGKRGADLYAIQDAAAATQNFLLAAHDAGLGAVWVGAFDEETVRRIVSIPSYARPVALVPVGKPAEEPEPSDRLPLGSLLHREHW